MEYVYAALLLHSAGKDVNEDGIKKVVEASGVAADEVRIKALVAALDGVDIAQSSPRPLPCPWPPQPQLRLPQPPPPRAQPRKKRLKRTRKQLRRAA